jgi:hypothetical protein
MINGEPTGSNRGNEENDPSGYAVEYAFDSGEAAAARLVELVPKS